MPVFPIFLDLRGRRCLVVGGGTVGRDKTRSLAEAGAEVLVVDPSPSPGFPHDGPGRVTVETRAFRPEDCDGRVLVFACTGEPRVNDAVVAAAAERGVPVCDAGTGADRSCRPDRRDGSVRHATFSTGAVLRRGDLCVAVSSAGASPALAAAARDRIEAAIGDEFAEATAVLSALRERLQAQVADRAARHAALRGVIAGGLLEMLRDGRRADAAALVEDALDCAGRRASQEETHEPQDEERDDARDEEGRPCTR